MSVIPARRRRELARAVSGAGLAAALAGSALVAGALLPTAYAAVDPGDPIEEHIVPADSTPSRACEARGYEGAEFLYSGGQGSAPVDVIVDDDTNLLDVHVLEDDFRVLAVFVAGRGPSHYAFHGDPYLEGDDLLGMYPPGAEPGGVADLLDEEAASLDEGEADLLDEETAGVDEEAAGLHEDADLLDERDDYGYTHPPTYDKDKKKHKDEPYPPPTTPTINHWLVCGETVDEPEPEPALAILEPVCDDDVPYLEYVIDPQGTDTEDGDVTITWINPDGDDVVVENLPLAARVLWAGAVTDEDGNPLDWPGWTQLEDGTWVEGDEFDWVRPAVDIVVTVNPDFELTVDYPPSSPICDANPPQDEPPGETLPNTGGNALLAAAGGGLLLGGVALLLLGRRSARSKS